MLYVPRRDFKDLVATALDQIRPDLDGTEIMQILGIGPGPQVGKAYKFLLEHRMENGPVDKEEASRLLRDWAASTAS